MKNLQASRYGKFYIVNWISNLNNANLVPLPELERELSAEGLTFTWLGEPLAQVPVNRLEEVKARLEHAGYELCEV